MALFDGLKNLFWQKSSEARIVASFQKNGQPLTTPANYEAFAHKGYNHNLVVYTAISKITTACGSVEWNLFKKTRGRKSDWEELEQHPLLDLLHRPNPMQSTSEFIESLVGFKKIAGNSYVEASKPSSNRPPLELWPVRPDKMRIVPGTKGYPLKFEFKYGDRVKYWDVDQITLKSDILHMKTFNPVDDWYGLSPIQAMLLSMDQYNAGQRWNLSLLQNEARPSGILQMAVTKDNPRGSLTDTQYQQLKAQVEEKTGPFNSGRPMILQGGLEWKQMALSPKDMDFLQLKSTTANDIAVAYGVPAELLGLGTKTFANYKEARLAFYEDTVLPTLGSLRDSFNQWLAPMFGDDLYIDYNEDSIDALVEKREQKYTSLQQSTFLTINEKREAAGYERIEGLDVIQVGQTPLHIDELEDFFGEEEAPEPPIDQEEELEDDETEEDQEQDTGDKSSGIAFKSINLLTSREKRKSWFQQNRLRERLARPFEKELEQGFDKLTSNLVNSADKLKGITDKKHLEYALLNEIDKWSDDSLKPTLSKHIETAVKVFGQTVIRDGKSHGIELSTKKLSWFDDFVMRYVEKTTGSRITTIRNTNQKRVKRIVSEWVADTIQEGSTLPELSKYLEMEFPKQTKANAMRISRTEVAAASSNGSLEAAKSLEIPTLQKEWVSADDDRVRGLDPKDTVSHIAMSGDTINIDDKYVVPNKKGGDDMMDGPHDSSAPAEQVINCRCTLVYNNRG